MSNQRDTDATSAVKADETETVRKCAYFGILFGVVFLFGVFQTLVSAEHLRDYFYPTLHDFCLQVGAIGITWIILFAMIHWISKRAARTFVQRSKSLALKVGLATLIFFIVGEVALRGFFWDGMSFGNHTGPMIKRYERDFQLNRFGSRGPEVGNVKGPNSVRIVVQGDSITWGQGIKNEDKLYTSRLLSMLRKDYPNVEMAVLAQGGKEVDFHAEQISELGAQLSPDIIVYQWYINDIELTTKHLRPSKQRFWRRPFFDRLMRKVSYFWYFVDYQLDVLSPTPAESYTDYILENFEPNTAAWQAFEEKFKEWAGAAKTHASRVVVVIYPTLERPDCERLAVIRGKVRELCHKESVEVLDLAEPLADLMGKTQEVAATRYDTHPNEMVHGRIAEALHQWLTARWPELFEK